jgi:hypothetical protein
MGRSGADLGADGAAKADLRRRALACPGWDWMPGMATSHGRRRCLVRHTVVTRPGEGPDLDDPGTLGCLLALVRKAVGCAFLSTTYSNNPADPAWRVVYRFEYIGRGRSEAEALVSALEWAGRWSVESAMARGAR